MDGEKDSREQTPVLSGNDLAAKASHIGPGGFTSLKCKGEPSITTLRKSSLVCFSEKVSWTIFVIGQIGAIGLIMIGLIGWG